MFRILHLDASARPGRSDQQAHGSHTRRLGARFVERWRALRPEDPVSYRDIGASPPLPVTGDWIRAAFTPPAKREPWMQEVLAESDRLIDELVASDLIVAGVPMYNFGMPAQFKAYIDNVVRVGRTFGFDRSRAGEPYWPMLAGQGKRLVILSARGDFGYAPGQRLAHTNHVETGVATPLQYLGIDCVARVAVEYDEFGDERLAQSLQRAEAEVDHWVERLAGEVAAAATACA
jgi:FMN-dependent NADH-azoreductase